MTEAEVNEIAGRIRFLGLHKWSGPSHEALEQLLHDDAPALVGEVRKLRRLLTSTIDALGAELTLHLDGDVKSKLLAFKRETEAPRRRPADPKSK
jgi:hypothetical protein